MFVTTSEIVACLDAPNAGAKDKKLNSTARAGLISISGDILISITALAIGIIGLYKIGLLQGMPSAACYGLISVSGAITLAWAAYTIRYKGELYDFVSTLFKASVSSNPEKYFTAYEEKHPPYEPV